MNDDTAIADLADMLSVWINRDLSSREIAGRIHAAGWRRPGLASPNDVGKVAVALSLFASALMSGEPWSEACALASKEAHDALVRLSGAVRSGPITEAQVEAGARAVLEAAAVPAQPAPPRVP